MAALLARLQRRRHQSQWVTLNRRMYALTRELFPDMPEIELQGRVFRAFMSLRDDSWREVA